MFVNPVACIHKTNHLTVLLFWLYYHPYVMRSKEISLKLNVWHQFSIWLNCSLGGRGTFCWKPHLNQTSGSKVIAIEGFSKTIDNKRNAFLFLVVSHNQCFRLPTDSTRSQHICYVVTWYRISHLSAHFASTNGVTSLAECLAMLPIAPVKKIKSRYGWIW